MPFEDRFDADEQFLLRVLPSMVSSAVVFSASSGAVGTIKEQLASAKGALAGMTHYPDNEIIRSVAPDVSDREGAIDAAKALRVESDERLAEKGIDTFEELCTQLAQDCGAVAAILAAKASSEEASQYREWVLGIGQGVAAAAREGGFLGIGGKTLSSGEVKVLDDVRRHLSLRDND